MTSLTLYSLGRHGAGFAANRATMKTRRLIALVAVVTGGACNLDKLLAPGDPVAPAGATAASLVFTTQPADARAGAPILVRVTARDSAGRRVTQYDSTITITLGDNPGGATLFGKKDVAASGGVAVFQDLSLDKVSTGYTLSASSVDLSAVKSTGFAISPGTPTKLTFMVQPSDAQANSAIQPPVQVAAADSFDNPATNFTGSVRVRLGTDGSVTQNAQLSGTVTVSASGGVATFANLRIDQIGNGYTLTAAFSSGSAVDTSAAFNVYPVPPPTGGMTAKTSTTGSSLDSDGYTVAVDGGAGQPIPSNSSNGVTFTGLTAGDHNVELKDVAQNCVVGGSNPRTVTVTAGNTVTTTFNVTCSTPPPTTGDLTVSTSTSGANLDPDGYSVAVDGGNSRAIGLNNNVTYPGLAAGDHTVQLNGVAQNCAVAGSNPRTVTVTAGGTAQTSFAVTCTAPPPPTNQPPSVNAGPDAQLVIGGVLTYTLNASFSDPDHDGPWNFTIDWGDNSSESGNTSTEGSISRSHTYPLGVIASYTVRLSVTDAHGAKGEDTAVVNVTL